MLNLHSTLPLCALAHATRHPPLPLSLSGKKRKRRRDGDSKAGGSNSGGGGSGRGGRGADRRRAAANVDSGDEDSDPEAGPAVQESDEEDDSETAAEKRLRLAKEFISRIEDEERHKVDGHDVDAEAIAHRLRDDLSNEKGILSRNAAKYISAAAAATTAVDASDGDTGAGGAASAAAAAAGVVASSGGRQVLRFKGQPVTCMVLSADAKYVFCGSKCGTIVQWSLATGEKLVEHERSEEMESTQKQGGGKVYERHGNDTHGAQGHTAEILALAITSDGKMLASGTFPCAAVLSFHFRACLLLLVLLLLRVGG